MGKKLGKGAGPFNSPGYGEAIEGTSVTEIVVIGEAEGATPLAALMGEPLSAQSPIDIEKDVVCLPYSSGTTGLSSLSPASRF